MNKYAGLNGIYNDRSERLLGKVVDRSNEMAGIYRRPGRKLASSELRNSQQYRSVDQMRAASDIIISDRSPSLITKVS